MNANEELYFCLELTESEHYIVEDNIRKTWPLLEMVYYRQLKEGHVPMIREIKLRGQKAEIQRFKRWAKLEKLTENVVKNPYSIARKTGPYLYNHTWISV